MLGRIIVKTHPGILVQFRSQKYPCLLLNRSIPHTLHNIVFIRLTYGALILLGPILHNVYIVSQKHDLFQSVGYVDIGNLLFPGALLDVILQLFRLSCRKR